MHPQASPSIDPFIVTMIAKDTMRLEPRSPTLSITDMKLTPHRRTVIFKDKITVHRILNRKQLTKKEVKDCYMNATDFTRIRREIKWLLRREKAGSLQPEDVDHLRGLEAYINHETTLKNAIKKKYIIRSVLSHSHSGVDGTESVSKIYHKLSKTTARLAHKRGLRDQQGNSSIAPLPQVMDR